MLVEVGERKFKMNWKHEPFRSKAMTWLYLNEDKADDQLVEILKVADRAERASAKRLGRTTCFIENVEHPGDSKVEATTECSLLENSYKKDEGRKESLTKALSAYGFDVDERAQVWQQYFDRKASG